MSFDHEVNLVKAELGSYRFGAEQTAPTEQPDPPALLEALEIACRGLPITSREAQEALAPEDLTAWKHGDLPPDTLRDFARVLSWRREMDQGKVPAKAPAHYRAQALCASCGPIWHWRVGEALSCPWCRNRKAGRHIPRPPVACRECRH